MTLEQVGVAAAAIVAAAGVLGVALKTARVAWRGFRKLGHLVDELLGAEARGTRPAIPGWAARLDQIQEDLSKVKAQVFPNGGSSLRDVVDELRVELVDHLAEATEARRLFSDHLSTGGVHVAVPPGGSLTVTPSASPGTTGPT
jgi:hypothetical protein